jgi:hypothetical protein
MLSLSQSKSRDPVSARGIGRLTFEFTAQIRSTRRTEGPSTVAPSTLPDSEASFMIEVHNYPVPGNSSAKSISRFLLQ